MPVSINVKLSAGHAFRWHMSRVTNDTNDDTTTGQDADPSDGGMIQAETQPCLGRELKSPADKVTNHIRMTDHQLITVLPLRGFSTMEVLPEGSLDTGSVLEELLKREIGVNKIVITVLPSYITCRLLWTPVTNWRLWWDRGAFLQQRAMLHGDIRK